MADGRGTTPGELAIMLGGAVALVFSFFDFYTAPYGSAKVWTTGLFPVAPLMVVFVTIMAAQVALTTFTHVELPARVLGFTWVQMHLILGFFAVVNAVAWLLLSKGGRSFGIGFWGIVLGCAAAFVGSILVSTERGGPHSGR